MKKPGSIRRIGARLGMTAVAAGVLLASATATGASAAAPASPQGPGPDQSIHSAPA